VKFCSLFHTFGSSQSNPVCTFPLSSVRLFRFYPRRFGSHVGFYVRIASYYFAGVLRHSFQTIDRRCSHSVASSARVRMCLSYVQLVPCSTLRIFPFLASDTFSRKLTISLSTTSATSKTSTMVDSAGSPPHSAAVSLHKLSRLYR
jgi:hypothetical protein